MKVLGGGARVEQTVPRAPEGAELVIGDPEVLVAPPLPPHVEPPPERWLTGNLLTSMGPGDAPNVWEAHATEHVFPSEAGLVAVAVFADVPDAEYHLERRSSAKDPAGQPSTVEAQLPPN